MQPPVKIAVVKVDGTTQFETRADYLGAVQQGSSDFYRPLLVSPGLVLWYDADAPTKLSPENVVVRQLFGLWHPLFGDVVLTGVADAVGHVTPVPAEAVEALSTYSYTV